MDLRARAKVAFIAMEVEDFGHSKDEAEQHWGALNEEQQNEYLEAATACLDANAEEAAERAYNAYQHIGEGDLPELFWENLVKDETRSWVVFAETCRAL